MKYLDERIIGTFGITPKELGGDGVYRYELVDEDDPNQPTLFYGNTYLSGTDYISIDVTSIVRNLKWKPDFFKQLPTDSVNKITTQQSYNSEIVRNFGVYVTNKDESEWWNVGIKVNMMYRYPLLKNDMVSGLNYDYSEYRKSWHALQGGYHPAGEREQYFKLIPTYPYILTENYYGVFNVFVSNDVLNVEGAAIAFFNDGWSWSKRYNFGLLKNNNTCFVVPLSLLFDNAFIGVERKDGGMRVIGGQAVKINLCPAKYYLMWQDRAGSFQSQPFDKISTYSENYEREYITNYTGLKSPNNITVNPRIKIQTGYIKEELFPYYESIYTSPYLLLYDTEQDRSYLVNVTGDYVEKTFKNQSRQMFNLQLELEFATQQNIIY